LGLYAQSMKGGKLFFENQLLERVFLVNEILPNDFNKSNIKIDE
jgi:hypothetical protein